MHSLLDRVIMQNTELYRRGVVLPLSSDAEKLLLQNDIEMDTPVDYLEIPDQAFFELLWELGLFQEINSRVGSMIDDYEQEFIAAESLRLVRDAVEAISMQRAMMRGDIHEFLSKLKILTEKGIALKRSMLFVL
jgi:hypothetical protein